MLKSMLIFINVVKVPLAAISCWFETFQFWIGFLLSFSCLTGGDALIFWDFKILSVKILMIFWISLNFTLLFLRTLNSFFYSLRLRIVYMTRKISRLRAGKKHFFHEKYFFCCWRLWAILKEVDSFPPNFWLCDAFWPLCHLPVVTYLKW